ncbi:hypothetical protein AB3N62_01970 [Leptospira sp. WS4.C2]
MKKIIFLLLLTAFTVSHAEEVTSKNESPSDREDSKIENRQRWDLVWRSAVLPGWGLIHAKAYRKGYVVAGITTLLARSEYRGHNEEDQKRETFSESQKLLQFSYLSQPTFSDQNLLLLLLSLDSKKDLDKIRENNELKLTLLGLKYIMQLGYTYWFGISWEKGTNQSGLQFDIQKDSISMGQNSNAQKFLISYDLSF